MVTYVPNIMAYGPRPDNVYLELNEVGKQVSGSSAPHTAAHQPLAPDLETPELPCPTPRVHYQLRYTYVYNHSNSDKHCNLIG